MGKDKTALLRLIFIDKKIREGMACGILANCSSMAAEYEVSSKSILRDIDYLRYQMAAPIAYDSSRRGYYYQEEQYRLPAIDLTESDLFAICIAEKTLTQHENSPVYHRLRTVFDKIEASLPASVTIQPDWLAESLSVAPEPQTSIDQAIWSTVTEGLRKHLALHILHERPGADAPTERRFDPYHIVHCDGEWYLIGYCHLRAAQRTLAISRIRSATLLADAFTVPADFSPAPFHGGRFGLFGSGRDQLVRIRFNRDHAPYLLERQWHPEQEISKLADGGVDLTFPAANLHTVRQWVLSWGSGAKALAPASLVAAVRTELQKAAASYGESGTPLEQGG
ncbi:MAG: WYL domain-containing protein [Desulfobulbaceae bacterium]|nr:WYL domain-containing protein [Desulfobulbaceae bacterium]